MDSCCSQSSLQSCCFPFSSSWTWYPVQLDSQRSRIDVKLMVDGWEMSSIKHPIASCGSFPSHVCPSILRIFNWRHTTQNTSYERWQCWSMCLRLNQWHLVAPPWPLHNITTTPFTHNNKNHEVLPRFSHLGHHLPCLHFQRLFHRPPRCCDALDLFHNQLECVWKPKNQGSDWGRGGCFGFQVLARGMGLQGLWLHLQQSKCWKD